MSGHDRHHEGTALRPQAVDARDANLPGSPQNRPQASHKNRPQASRSCPRVAGFALRPPGESAVPQCRLASWRHGSRYPPQCCDGSLLLPHGQACRPLRCGHGSLRRAHHAKQDGTRRHLRSGSGRGTRSQPPGCSPAVRLRRPGVSSVRLRRPGVSSHGSRRPCALTAPGGPGLSWYPSARHQRPTHGCCVPPGSSQAHGDRLQPRSGLSGGHRHRPRRADGPGRRRRQMPAVPGHSCQRAWRPSKPLGSRYLIPGSSASRIPRPRSSTSSFNTTQTSEEGRSTTSGATLFKHVRRRPTLPRGPPRSTIGAEGLNFRVRNGTGCFPFAMATETLWRCAGRTPARAARPWRVQRRPHPGNRTVDANMNTDCRSQATRPSSTGQLHASQRFHLRPINPVVWLGALPG